MQNQHLSEIWVYPIKGLSGISVNRARVEKRGLQYDRRWMLVDAQGKFMTQREIPKMVQLGTAIEADQLRVFDKNDPKNELVIPLAGSLDGLQRTMVQIWSARCKAAILPKYINDWFSYILGQNLRLAYMPAGTRRAADGRYAPKGQYVSFADGFPYLLIGQASLDELNQRLPEQIPMNRFRPNLVFTGGAAFEEDNWTDFSIGEVPLRCVKPCARCIVITTDQETGIRSPEPLRTLSGYRKNGNKVLFGQNVIWTGNGVQEIRTGMRIVKD